jgi:hypothetical protein
MKVSFIFLIKRVFDEKVTFGLLVFEIFLGDISTYLRSKEIDFNTIVPRERKIE